MKRNQKDNINQESNNQDNINQDRLHSFLVLVKQVSVIRNQDVIRLLMIILQEQLVNFLEWVIIM